MKKYRLPRRPTRPQQPARGSDSTGDVERSIDKIKWCYETGKQFLEFPKNARGRRMIKELAEAKGIPEKESRRYVQFVGDYTEQELEEIFTVFREFQRALSFTHFRALFGVKDESLKSKLLLQAVRERLSTAGLRRLKARTVGSPKSNAGRRPDLLDLDDEDLAEAVDREKEKFRRHLEQVIDRPRSLRADLRERYMTMLQHLQ